ncbi:hypothetical protein STEG23_017311 [Scotinomys teguina]
MVEMHRQSGSGKKPKCSQSQAKGASQLDIPGNNGTQKRHRCLWRGNAEKVEKKKGRVLSTYLLQRSVCYLHSPPELQEKGRSPNIWGHTASASLSIRDNIGLCCPVFLQTGQLNGVSAPDIYDLGKLQATASDAVSGGLVSILSDNGCVEGRSVGLFTTSRHFKRNPERKADRIANGTENKEEVDGNSSMVHFDDKLI